MLKIGKELGGEDALRGMVQKLELLLRLKLQQNVPMTEETEDEILTYQKTSQSELLSAALSNTSSYYHARSSSKKYPRPSRQKMKSRHTKIYPKAY